ncbi:hypothetical protein [Pelagibius sp. Alg239-R121]|uniref:hypothetical protein n=1 Tax=Pelagibius sp. Alg239-R121 TaxID=2993448 RepID=UPI0024A61E06|nr:hypothetical protein [Pelagibius sp. Alg239-R121]
MKPISRFRTAAVAAPLALSLLLQGCTGTNPIKDVERVFTGIPTEERPGMTEEQRRLVRLAAESERIRGQALLGGAVVGGVLGALICEDTLSLCTAGVAVGGATIGYFAGYYFAKKKEDAEAEQKGIQASIDGANSSLSFYQARADASAAVVRQARARISRLNESSLATEAQRKAYAMEVETMEEDRDRIGGMVSQLSADITFMEAEIDGRQSFANEDTSDLEEQKVALEKINNRMREQLKNMNAELDRVPEEVTS